MGGGPAVLRDAAQALPSVDAGAHEGVRLVPPQARGISFGKLWQATQARRRHGVPGRLEAGDEVHTSLEERVAREVRGRIFEMGPEAMLEHAYELAKKHELGLCLYEMEKGETHMGDRRGLAWTAVSMGDHAVRRGGRKAETRRCHQSGLEGHLQIDCNRPPTCDHCKKEGHMRLQRPLTIVELFGGIGTSLAAALKAGCKGVSRAGKGKGLEGPRSMLFLALLWVMKLIYQQHGEYLYILENPDFSTDCKEPVRRMQEVVAATLGAGVAWDAVQQGYYSHKEEPSAKEREMAMGFILGATAAPGVEEAQMREALGRAMNAESMHWLVHVIQIHLAAKQLEMEAEVGGPRRRHRGQGGGKLVEGGAIPAGHASGETAAAQAGLGADGKGGIRLHLAGAGQVHGEGARDKFDGRNSSVPAQTEDEPRGLGNLSREVSRAARSRPHQALRVGIRSRHGGGSEKGTHGRDLATTHVQGLPRPEQADDAGPVPHAKIQGASVFSTLDLHQGFNQIRIAAADVRKTAFHGPDGLYESLFTPSGLNTGTGGASSGGAGIGGTGAGGTRSKGVGARGTTSSSPPPPPHHHDLRFQAASRCALKEQETLVQETLELEQQQQELQRQELQQQQQPQQPLQLFLSVSGLRTLGLPSSSSPPPPAHGLPPPASSPAIVSPPPSQPAPPVVPHSRVRSCPPCACSSSPVDDLCIALLCSSPRRSPPTSVLLSPSESSLPISSTPIFDYYHTFRLGSPVFSPLLLWTLAPPPLSVSALTAVVADLASTRCLDYATHMVAPRPLFARGKSSLGCDVLEDKQFELEFLEAASPHLCAMLLAPDGDPSAFDIPNFSTHCETVSGQWDS
ncbi:unnamed protein product [Closterium sp. NIES-53]